MKPGMYLSHWFLGNLSKVFVFQCFFFFFNKKKVFVVDSLTLAM